MLWEGGRWARGRGAGEERRMHPLCRTGQGDGRLIASRTSVMLPWCGSIAWASGMENSDLLSERLFLTQLNPNQLEAFKHRSATAAQLL